MTVVVNNNGGAGNGTVVSCGSFAYQDAQQRQKASNAGEEWVPASVSEDSVVFAKYGVDPSSVGCGHSPGEPDNKCFGCSLGRTGFPAKGSNVKTFVERMAAMQGSTGSVLERAEAIRDDHEALIEKPKRKLEKMLAREGETKKEGIGFNGGNERKRPFSETLRDSRERNATDASFEDENRESSDRKRRRTTAETASSRNSVLATASREKTSEWDVPQIYNHVKRHGTSVVGEVQQRRNALTRMMDTMERNSTFVAHATRKNDFGGPLLKADPDQCKVYLALLKSWIDLSKSRPDLWKPLYDPEKKSDAISAGASSNPKCGVDVSSYVLFSGKKARAISKRTK
jgi:hypothetical protein